MFVSIIRFRIQIDTFTAISGRQTVDDNHAVAPSATVDCRRRGIFQNGNVLNIVSIHFEIRKINRNAINHDQRLLAIGNGGSASNHN